MRAARFSEASLNVAAKRQTARSVSIFTHAAVSACACFRRRSASTEISSSSGCHEKNAYASLTRVGKPTRPFPASSNTTPSTSSFGSGVLHVVFAVGNLLMQMIATRPLRPCQRPFRPVQTALLGLEPGQTSFVMEDVVHNAPHQR